MMQSHPCRGSAILVALLVMALVTATAALITLHQQAQIQNALLMVNADKSYLAAKQVEVWASLALLEDLKTAKENNHSLTDPAIPPIDEFPQIFEPTTLDYAYQVSGQLEDLQGRFNLNNLAQADHAQVNFKVFTRLIQIVDPDISDTNAKQIAQSTSDWVSNPEQLASNNTGANTQQWTYTNNQNDNSNANVPSSANTAATTAVKNDKKYYLKQKPPYRMPQALMVSVSELLLVKGMTPNLYARLHPYITALPEVTVVNINTAPAEVIASLGKNGMTLDDAKNLVDDREGGTYQSLSDFLNDHLLQDAGITQQDITLNSTYFLVTAKVTNGAQSLWLRALLHRPLPTSSASNSSNSTPNSPQNNGNNTTTSHPPTFPVTILWESRGGI